MRAYLPLALLQLSHWRFGRVALCPTTTTSTTNWMCSIIIYEWVACKSEIYMNNPNAEEKMKMWWKVNGFVVQFTRTFTSPRKFNAYLYRSEHSLAKTASTMCLKTNYECLSWNSRKLPLDILVTWLSYSSALGWNVSRLTSTDKKKVPLRLQQMTNSAKLIST